jgi:NADPH-dependent 2,4-dienoyl-CoA reductase/sulfur reductase-like enzyme/rhodanese-related sulfurtransferase
MKIVVIGAVAAGTSAAAKARRNNEDCEITIYEMDRDISYSGCGLPYYIGNEIEDRDEIVPRDAKYFKKKYNIDIFTAHEVLNINAKDKTLMVKNLQTGESFEDKFDELIIATGAKAFVPNISGINMKNVFSLRNVTNADDIHQFILRNNPKKTVIVGSGFIGLEMAENLKHINIDVTIVELAEHIMPAMDGDMSAYIEKHLKEKGVEFILGDSVTAIVNDKDEIANKIILKSGREIETDMVIMAVGIRPNVDLAIESGIEIGETGAIKVNTKMQTNLESIYACGDCAESYSVITNKNIYRPLGSTANKTGRIAGDQATGGDLEFRGILGTGIFRVFDLAVAQTGLTEKEALKEGFEVVVCHNIKPHKATYLGGKEMVIKAVADKNSRRVLGAQIVGTEGVDKRIDVLVTAMTFGAKVEDLIHLDLAYSPTFSIAKDPVIYTGMILDNAIKRDRKLITPQHLQKKIKDSEDVTIIDARASSQYESAHVDGAVNIPQDKLREECKNMDKSKSVVTYCNKGVTGNAAQNILINNGFNEVYNLSGGHKNFKTQSEN